MNKWADDVARNRMHHRGAIRRFRASMRILLLVAGVVLAGLALFVGAMSLRHIGATERKLHHLAALLGGSAVLCLGLHATFFLLPEWLDERRSTSRLRRKDESRARRSDRDRRSGMAMILALAAVALIGFLLMAMNRNQRRLSAQTRRQIERVQLREAAADAACAALQRLADDTDLRVDSTNDAWAATEKVEQPDGIVTVTRVLDAQARFDLNNLAAGRAPSNRPPDVVLADLFTLGGHFAVSPFLQRLSDWVQPDPIEATAYADRIPPYAPPGRPLHTLDELAHVAGFEPAFLERTPRGERLGGFDAQVMDSVTVFPLPRNDLVPVNVNTANGDTLRGVIGLDREDLVRAILLVREEKPIQSLDPLAALDDNPRSARDWRPYLSVRSDWFIVQSEARHGERMERIDALARRGEKGDVRVVQWIF